MGMNTDQFKREMRQMQEEIKDGIAYAIKEAVGAGFENSLRPKQAGGMPKITGWMRSNAYVTLNVAISDTIGSKSAVDTSRRDRLFKAFKNERTDRIIDARNIYITYTVPYASYVNDGTSTQGGQHFLELALQDIEETLIRKGNIK